MIDLRNEGINIQVNVNDLIKIWDGLTKIIIKVQTDLIKIKFQKMSEIAQQNKSGATPELLELVETLEKIVSFIKTDSTPATEPEAE